MDIKVNECISERKVKVLYAYGKKVDENETITNIKYYDSSDNSNHWTTVKALSKKLLDGEVFIYAGKYDKESDSFKNVCIVIPMIKDGDYYITSVTDDKKTNNLDHLPLYDK